MKKIILILATLTNCCFAIQISSTLESKPNLNTTVNSDSAIKIEEYMKTKVGLVSLVESNSITINDKSYSKSIDYRVYGKIVKNSVVKFNTNKSNQITDMWVINEKK